MLRWFTRSLLALVACAVLPVVCQAQSGWQAGAASVVITPKQSMYMAGYASRKTPSEGVVTDLMVKVLVLQDTAGKRAVFLTSDLISIPQPLRAQVADLIKDKYKIDPAGLMMNCSHTHCGPVVRDNVETSVMYSVDAEHAKRIEDYFVQLRDQIVATIGQAIDKLEPVKVGYSYARCGFAMNRRLPSSTGFQNSPYPDGPVDHDVQVLRVETADGKLKAVAFGYACHNTTTGLMQFNGDYAGYAQAELEAAHPGTVALFVMGCGGDQNPYPRGKIEMAQTHGKSLASAVEAALLPAATPIDSQLSFAYEEIDLPFAPLTREEILARQASKDTFDQRRGAALLKELEETGKVRESYPYPVQAFRLGNHLTLVTLGGEVVIDYSLRLKRELQQRLKGPVWVAGYSNDVMAYIP
ncbi:MAG: neutral/alkaline non-lysosomal ceramidase N-terminal domain-containing protein, partial [Pirellulaceae bacterium]|nr:neutral/alkaline non-lysosomal ceramidase N-terminal domain-containing protein [Pirellulaceae bacterium]